MKNTTLFFTTAFFIGLLNAHSSAYAEGSGLYDSPRSNYMASTMQERNGQDEKGVVPLITLTETLGINASELVSSGAPLYRSADVLADISEAIVYVNIDQLSDRNRVSILHTVHETLALGYPVILESNLYDVKALHSLVGEQFPQVETNKLTEVAILLQSIDGEISASDTSPTLASELAGIPYERTADFLMRPSSSDRSLTPQEFEQMIQAQKGDSRNSRNPGDNWLLRYAKKAYESTPADGLFNLILNWNVVDVWKYTGASNSTTYCIVAWRGSVSLGDWGRDFESVGTIRINQTPNNGARGGRGFVERLHNLDGVRTAMNNNDCDEIMVTGHSLGAAMTQVHSYQLLYDPDFDIKQFAAYNPPRVANSTMQSVFQSLNGRVDWGYDIYCRTGDPVNPLPPGISRLGPIGNPNWGCTSWSPRVSWINPIANHDLDAW